MAAASLCPVPDHTDKQVLGAESQPQHQLPCLVPHRMERAGQPSLQDTDTPLALVHSAVLCDHRPEHCPCSSARPVLSSQPKDVLPSKGGGCSASRKSQGWSRGALLPRSLEKAEIPLCHQRTPTAKCSAHVPVTSCSPPGHVPIMSTCPAQGAPCSRYLRPMLCVMGVSTSPSTAFLCLHPHLLRGDVPGAECQESCPRPLAGRQSPACCRSSAAAGQWH